MDTINIRYGQSVTLPIDTGDPSAETAVIYVGKPGESYILSGSTDLVEGKGTIKFTPLETEKPLGVYSYQINVIGADGNIGKYPSADNCSSCEDDFPKFIIREALDLTEVS